jgi:ketosteroid isomerase-like protein
MTADDRTPTTLVVERLDRAMNAHDLEAFLACFDEDYESEQPTHPDRAFRGREQVRENWSAIFRGIPDFRSELIRAVSSDDTEWSEWRWQGTQTDGTRLQMAGVIIAGIREGRFIWAHLYVEPVEEAGAGITAAVRRMTGDAQAPGGEDAGVS